MSLITIPGSADRLDWPSWGLPLTQAVNDHDTRIGAIEQISPWTNITPLNGWTNQAGYSPFRFRPFLRDNVQIEATLNIGTSTNGIIIGNIAAPYRPSIIRAWPIAGNGASANAVPKIELDASGNFKCWDYTTGLFVQFNVIVPIS